MSLLEEEEEEEEEDLTGRGLMVVKLEMNPAWREGKGGREGGREGEREKGSEGGEGGSEGVTKLAREGLVKWKEGKGEEGRGARIGRRVN